MAGSSARHCPDTDHPTRHHSNHPQPERDRLDRLAEHVPGVLYQYVLYPDGRSAFPYASHGLKDIYGVLPEQVRNDASPVFAVIHPDDIERVSNSIHDAAQRLGLWQCEYRVCLPERGERWVSGQATPQRQADGSILWHGYIHDVTERKSREFELGQAHRLASKASQAKSQFLAQLSHEIRTPMASIIGLSQLGMTESDPARLHELQMKILASGRMVLGILNDVLDLSKIEAGKMEIDPQPFLLQRLFDGLLTLFGVSAQAKGLNLSFEIDPRAGSAYVADELRLHQVLANLVSNAVKFTRAGSITLRVRWLSHTDGVDTLEFSVTDTGMGITDAQKECLFQAFSQAPQIGREHGGSGLGLNISQRLVAAMGGTPLKVYSQSGAGSTFHFELPMARCPLDQHAELEQRLAKADLRGQTLSGHVLLVEDNPINQEVTREQLRRLGLTVTVVGNGQQAVQAMQDQARSYDLILMDIQMPLMDGYTATGHIRQTHPDVPIIALTAAAMVEDREKALHEGMSGHVSKPVELSKLREVLSQWLSGQGSGSQRGVDVEPIEVAAAAVFAPDQGLQRLGGNLALYRKLLIQFRQQLIQDRYRLAAEVDQLPAEMDTGRTGMTCNSLQNDLHSLKGVAANLGFNALADVAAHAHTRLVSGAAIVSHAGSSLANQLTLALSALEQYLDDLPNTAVSRAANAAQAARDASIKQASAHVGALLRAVQANEYVDDEQLAVVAGLLPDDLHTRFWPAVQQAMDALDMERAGKTLNGLLAALERSS